MLMRAPSAKRTPNRARFWPTHTPQAGQAKEEIPGPQHQCFGRGAHGSMPQTSIDPVVMAAAAVLRLQIIISRTVAPTEEAVVIMGPLRAGTTENFIVLIDVREPKTVPIVEPNTPHFWLSHGVVMFQPRSVRYGRRAGPANSAPWPQLHG